MSWFFKCRQPAPSSTGRRLSRALSVALAAAITVVTATASVASDHQYTLTFTAGLGAYPRSAPTYEARTGAAVPEGTGISGSCWLSGGAITNPEGYTSDIWVRDTAGQYWSEAWLETGSYGAPPELAQCDTVLAPENPPIAPPERPTVYFGDSDLHYDTQLPMSYALWDHYLWGNGAAAVLDGNRVAASPGFREHFESMAIGDFGVWTPPRLSDLGLAVGSFTISRESENCWAMYDLYDFQPNVPQSLDVGEWANMVKEAVGYWPFYSYTLAGARAYDVNASGCF